MKTYVIDASVAGSSSPVIEEADTLTAPELIDLEMASILRKSVLRGQSDAVAAGAVLAAWAHNDVVRFPHAAHLSAVWAMRDNITPYDAAYVALARELGVPLLTADRRLAAAAAHYCDVIVVE